MKISFITMFFIMLFSSILFGQVDTTIAKEPTARAEIISFFIPGEHSIGMNINKGNGEYRIVVAMKEKEPGIPLDKTFYAPAAIYGIGEALPDGSYVTHRSTNDYSFQIDGLESGTRYFFKVFEVNGIGGKENYLTNEVEAKSFVTALDTPKLKEPTKTNSSMLFSWEAVKGATGYFFQASYDSGFKTFVDGYADARLSNNSIEIPKSLLKTDKRTIYIRVKAKNMQQESKFSESLSVNL